jgi:ribonuclease-3
MTLEDRLRYTFESPGLLRLALTHRSVSSEDPSRNDNERLEFLGDAVLQMVITDLLYESYPHLAEGQMAKVRASVVSGPTLAEIAREIDLGAHIELAPGEERTGGRGKDSILADAVEAILGSIYLDSGLQAARETVLGLWSERVAERAKSPGIKDYKTRLQEHLARDGKRPVYEVDGSGPDHSREFSAVVFVDGNRVGTGVGRSKKAAEQGAAEVALDSLIQDPR